MTDPIMLPKLPAQPTGTPKMKTSVEVTGQYLLSPIDDSNEHWSIPEWVSYATVRIMCLVILIGGVAILRAPENMVDRDLRLLVTMLTPAAGFKLMEAAGSAANKRGSKNGNGNGNGGGK